MPRSVLISVLVLVGSAASVSALPTGGPCGFDSDCDGDVDLVDFALWQLQFTGPCVCDAADPCTSAACVDGSCVFTPIECPVGEQCENGACVVGCQDHPDCDDGLACTVDTCILGTGDCCFTNIDAQCNDGLFCTGVETCDPADPDADTDGCINTGNPCINPTPICDEATDMCGFCFSNADCDDGIACTDDTCDGQSGACTNADNCGVQTCNLITGNCD